MREFAYRLEKFAFKHPILFWLLSALMFMALVVVALACAVMGVLLLVYVFYSIINEQTGTGVAFLMSIFFGYVGFIIARVAEAICPGSI